MYIVRVIHTYVLAKVVDTYVGGYFCEYNSSFQSIGNTETNVSVKKKKKYLSIGFLLNLNISSYTNGN